jgi:molybdopterin synthase catalytic subunit/molybdopterin synthase sulfur carrier subunit
MKITILFFGVTRDIAAIRQLPLEVQPGTNTLDVRALLAHRYSGLDEGLNYAMAVNEKLSAHAVELNDGDVVAIIPPVSGG